MDDYSSYIDSYVQLIDEHIESIYNLLIDERVKMLGWEYGESKKSQPKKQLNVFRLVSDMYYRENFHSDIIKFFLDPKEKHNEGSEFLYAFIDFINENYGDKVCLSKQNYRLAVAERERGKIDVLIRSEISKHCIVIENKIYNAPDMERQLPRYYDYMTERGYKIDSIVYLPLDINKKPDQSSWTKTDKEHVLPLLCIVPVFQKQGFNLVSGWIEPCTLKAKSLDCVSILRQYGELLKILNNNIMDNIILGKFYQSLQNGQSLETALSIKNMLEELPVYMADRLCEKFEDGNHRYAVWKYKPNFCGILFELDGTQYKIDIWTSERGYKIYVFGQKNGERPLEWAENMPSLESFSLTPDAYVRSDFSFYDEDKVIICVRSIIADMQERLLKQ
ncbi:MAG: PD-(D/E)XK nuclease family protein [Bacteroidales bacterium]|nr:PD-(D/E)XK nuclease family protein [Bacteroidales bacterium]